MSRLAWYAGASTALAVGVVASAFQQRANFYSAMVHLAQSSLSVLILANLAFFLYGSFVYALQRLCFGALRPVEIEQLWEKAWFAVTETCLAMTIFREEVGPFFVVMFTSLVTGKIWGWISEGRVEVLEQQPPANPGLFHTRLIVSLCLSIAYDFWLLNYAVRTVIQEARPSMMVMFLFEFAVLAVGSLHTTARYMLSLWEARTIKKQTERRLGDRRREVRVQRAEILRQRETEGSTETDGEPLPNEEDIDEMDIEVPGWEAKGLWILSLDLCADFVKLLIYSIFFCVLFTFYGLPIHIMRDLFLTTRSFVKRLGALLRYQQALKDMNKYPDATVEDLGREDTCIICREEMQPWDPANPGQVERSRPKKLPCGHILHFGCLKSWLERQQVCPTCRRSVVMDPPPQARNNRNPLMFRFGLDGNNQNQQPAGIGAGAGAAPGQPQGGPPPQDAGQGGQGGQDGQDGQPNGRNGAFRLNVGPFRVVFARGGPEDLEDLARRFGAHNGQHPAVNPAVQPQVQQVGAGQGGHDTSSSVLINDIQANLSRLTAQIIQVTDRVQQDVQGLRDAEAQVTNMTLLLREMSRLTQLRLNPTQQAAPPITDAAALAHHLQHVSDHESLHQQLLGQLQQGQQPPPPYHQPPQLQPQGLPTPPTVPHAHGDIPGDTSLSNLVQPPVGPLPDPVHPPIAPFAPRWTAPINRTVTRHVGAYMPTAIPAGSPELPEGVVIPPGWSLLPLQRIPQHGAPGASAGATSAPTAPGRSQSATRAPANEPYGELLVPGSSNNVATAAVWGTPRPNSAPVVNSATAVPEASTSVAGTAEPAISETEPQVTAPTPTCSPNQGGIAQLLSGEGSSTASENQQTDELLSQQQLDDPETSSSAANDKGKAATVDKGKAATVEDGDSDKEDET